MSTVTVARDTHTWTVRVEGDLLSTNAKDVRDAVAQLLAAPERLAPLSSVVLDLSTAKMIDSVGLNLIVAILRATKLAGGEMTIKHGNPNVQRILLFTRLDQQVDIQRAA